MRRQAFTTVSVLLASLHTSATSFAEPLQLEVILNGAPTRLIGSFVTSDGTHITASRQELQDLGVAAPGKGASDEVINLDNIAGLSYRYEVATQQVFISVSNELRAAKVYDASPSARIVPEVRTGYGAVLNYNLFAASNAFGPGGFGLNGLSATVDARAFSPMGVLSQSVILRTSGTGPIDKSSSSEALRLDTTFTYSDPKKLVVYRAGDVIAGGLPWTRPIRIGGAQVQRDFALRSDLVTMPLATTSGSAAVPSVADVYINNVKAFSQSVDAGPYQITNIPVIAGGGEARVILSDSAGHQIQTALPFYASPSLLAPDLMNFSVEAGLPRIGFGTNTDAYLTKEVASATLRRGIHDWLTVETHVEAGAGTANAGAGAILRAGGFGLASFAIAASRTGAAHGFQPYGSFETRVGVLTLGASAQATFGRYDDIAAATGRIQSIGFLRNERRLGIVDLVIPQWGVSSYNIGTFAPPKTMGRFSVGAPLPLNLGSISMSYIGATSVLGDRSRILTATYSRALPYSANFNATAFVDLGNHKSAGVWAGLSFPIGASASASFGISRSRDGSGVAADLSQPLGAEPGSIGWRLSGLEGKPASQLAAASYRSPYGWAEVTAAHANGGTGATAQIDGSIATMGSGLFFGNRIEDGFAVVETGVPGVGVSYENRPVGTTNQSGRLLVTGLRSYQSNKISIDTTRLPVDADVSTTEEYVAPADRSGVRLDFTVRTNRNAAVLVLRAPDGTPIPAGAHGAIAGTSESFIVGYDGRAYVHGLAKENTVFIDTAQGRCEASFSYVARENAQVSIPVSCRY